MTIKFGQSDHSKDQDRHAWRAYAAAVLHGAVTKWGTSSGDKALVLLVASVADAMLEEERKRR